jgi:hypothetical protein
MRYAWRLNRRRTPVRLRWSHLQHQRLSAADSHGTKIVVTGYFDNSSKNKYNPDPTQAVRFGDPTYDEMTVGLAEYTVDGQSVKASTAMSK